MNHTDYNGNDLLSIVPRSLFKDFNEINEIVLRSVDTYLKLNSYPTASTFIRVKTSTVTNKYEHRDTVIAMRKEGKKLKEIAECLNMSVSYACALSKIKHLHLKPKE